MNKLFLWITFSILIYANSILESKKSLIRLGVYDGQELLATSSSFSVSKNIFVTNYHAVKDAINFPTKYSIKALYAVKDSSYVYQNVTILHFDKEHDLAIIKIPEIDMKPLTLINNLDRESIREKYSATIVYSIGFPESSDMLQNGKITEKNLQPSTKKGIISKFNYFKIDNKLFEDTNMIETDATINRGNSGGPLIDSCGNVLGINEMKVSSRDVSNVYYAIRVDELIRFLDKNGVKYTTTDGICSLRLYQYQYIIIFIIIIVFLIVYIIKLKKIETENSIQKFKVIHLRSLNSDIQDIYLDRNKIFLLGRSSECDIQIDNKNISKIHLKIRLDDNGHIFITDLKSKNGTYINDIKLIPQEPFELEEKSILTIARKEITFIF